jgi:PII interaction protein X
MDSEQYLTHPMFGLLYLICQTTDSAALYSTLYTQQLFFRVTQVERLRFEPVSRDQARRTLEAQIKQLRFKGPSEELTRLLQFQKHYF